MSVASIRSPAVAGSFYPGTRGALSTLVRHLLEVPASPATRQPVTRAPKALIVPHAGFAYSGPVAASAYRALGAASAPVRVVLLGPSHRVAFRGIATPTATAFATPLGHVPVDRAAVAALEALPGVRPLDGAHVQEHSLEVQLPFLQTVLGPFSLVPLVVGEAGARDVAEAIDRLWDGPETLVVVSTDLSHYLDYDTARRIDGATRDSILALASGLQPEQACGCRPLNGLLNVAAQRGLQIETLDMRNSGDTAGDRHRVVGYGAWALYEAQPVDCPAARGQ